MFLKRLDIIGFKSFADRVSIDFVPGVTAVVGPNGSGKSNITDAIRWVLGEQSAKSLRGTKMEDIIFSGSDSRKPLNVAEVTLTLDNEDQFLPLEYQEISITRRVYRSGESEFFINKQPCRLKDIVDLFMDSGLGREAFSIISQGKVEEILSSKAEDRRTIFEEAAGVLKYKVRKKKAEHKLSETEDNLQRVNDILHELEQQLEPLKIQASIAKDYLEKREELEKYEVALIVHEIEQLHKQWEALKEQFAQHKQQEMQLSTHLQKEEAKIEQLRNEIAALDESIDGLQQVLLIASEELEKLEGKKEVFKERKKNAAKQQEQMNQKIQQLLEREKTLKAAEQKEQNMLEQVKKEIASLQAALKEKNTALSLYGLQLDEQIEQLKSEYIELVHQQASLKNERTHLQAQLAKLETRKKELAVTNQKQIDERERIQAQNQEKKRIIEQLEREIEQNEKALRKQEEKLEQRKEHYRQKEAMLYEAYQYLQQTKSRKEMLEAMQQDYSGFFQGVKEVLKAKDRLKGIKGAVVELIQAPKELETAIEVALGSAAQHVVVADEESAREAIRYLKQHAYGRATFLPLTVMQPKRIPSEHLSLLERHPAYVGIAANLISYDAAYENIMMNVLGTVIITKDLKSANELARLSQYRYRFVTLEGDVVNPGGAMTGGAITKQASSLLSRARELEKVTEKWRQMEEKTNQLERYLQNEKQAIYDEEKALLSQREQLDELRFTLQERKSELREIELHEQNINERLAVYDHEKEALEQEMKEIQTRLKEVDEKISALQNQLTEIDEQVQKWTEQKNVEQVSKERIQEEITALKVSLAEKQEQLRNQQEQIERMAKEYAETKRERMNIQHELERLMSEMSEHDRDEEQLEQLRQQRLQDKNETVQLIASRREQRFDYQAKLEHLEKETKELKRQYKQLIDALKDEEVRLTRTDVELDHLLSRLREEYALSFEAAKEKFPLSVSVDEARKKVKLIKLAIEDLGTVNLGAIEEYERISERHRFLTEQKSDLQQAKETLYQVIDEMDEEMKKRFATTFQQIRKQFASVFTELFGGGKADLQLTNPNDLLNTGVDIVAQPPGKKLQHLSLLSGGERALTAIALLFAILKVRPVPFCVLDEVEAALDEANVQRYAKYLKSFSAQTQFIVITHRKGTMEEADVLYGVTMQESGVSKLVSVRLEEAIKRKEGSR
ncbi:chromosome segregation protein SMC [Thermolongibacillus altinsuensis]|uniref:chromosome segregation protein SMC n=1 Tax=Thermolongibacillus altinsuensis TaxID=575256 RepID=UPI00242A2EAC|nr:chromosome segregation protein SMC [Thermolongibacillus altinsuensis]GMB08490.1 chromosome partition protein Smc [Thermolongibacillus altinsuensis]